MRLARCAAYALSRVKWRVMNVDSVSFLLLPGHRALSARERIDHRGPAAADGSPNWPSVRDVGQHALPSWCASVMTAI